jgi:hypothetical protein
LAIGAGSLLFGVGALSVSPLAANASSAPPTIEITGWPALADGVIAGSGFTPGGQVHLEVDLNGSVVTSTTVTAHNRIQTCDYDQVKPICIWSGGGTFTTTLSIPFVCDAPNQTEAVVATDLATTRTARIPIATSGFCPI